MARPGGWDVARATGQPFDCDAVSGGVLFDALHGSVSDEGVDGLFGPQVPVDDDTPVLDRVIGLTGRDPAWTPSLPPVPLGRAV